jgi:hypothetical protein
MTIEVSPETEDRLTAEAERRGISVEKLLQQFIDERAALTRHTQARPALPIWHLGSASLYHRRDLYNDAG